MTEVIRERRSTAGPLRPDQRGAAAVVAILAVAIALLIAGGVVAAVQVAGQGAQSPEDAVDNLLAAVADEDLLGVLEALVPAERASFEGSLRDLAAELRRLELASRTLDLRGIAGVEFEFRDVRYATEEVRPDLAVVRFLGGTARAAIDPARLPFGPFVDDLAGDGIADADPDASETELRTDPDDVGFATLKVDGSWYVSLWYSVAESARRQAGLPLPDLARRLRPSGSPTPEEAGEAFVRNLFSFDFARLFAQFPPGEARALHDYAPLFLDDLNTATAELRSLVDIQLRRIETEADVRSGRALVRISDVELTALIPDRRLVVTVAGGCVELRELGASSGERICAGDEGFSGVGDLVPDDFPDFPQEAPDVGLVAVEEGGVWYISPTRTVLDNLTALLQVFTVGDLEELRRFFGG